MGGGTGAQFIFTDFCPEVLTETPTNYLDTAYVIFLDTRTLDEHIKLSDDVETDVTDDICRTLQEHDYPIL